jgi:predicted ATPase
MPKLAGLLRDAAVRTQLVVTTHSDPLVDALSNTPESVVVCGKVGASTTLQRLEREKLGEWLKTFSLGSLWTRGQIGGTRW